MFHEIDFLTKSVINQFEYYTSGGYNDIFYLDEKDKPGDPDLALKILSYGTEYSDRNFDRVRRDSLILERLTRSPYGERGKSLSYRSRHIVCLLYPSCVCL